MKRCLTIAAIMLLLGVQPAQAQNLDVKPYVGVGIGAFGLEIKDTGVNIKNTVFGGYGKVGANIGDYLGVELRIGSTASGSKVSPIDPTVIPKVKADYFLSYLGKLQFPVTPDFKIYALLGGTTAKLKLTNNIGFNANPTKTGFTYGFGAEYYLQDKLSVGGEWMQYWTNVTVGTNLEAKVWGATATVAYHF